MKKLSFFLSFLALPAIAFGQNAFDAQFSELYAETNTSIFTEDTLVALYSNGDIQFDDLHPALQSELHFIGGSQFDYTTNAQMPAKRVKAPVMIPVVQRREIKEFEGDNTRSATRHWREIQAMNTKFRPFSSTSRRLNVRRSNSRTKTQIMNRSYLNEGICGGLYDQLDTQACDALTRYNRRK